MAEPGHGTRQRTLARRRALDILYEADLLEQEIPVVLARHAEGLGGLRRSPAPGRPREGGVLDPYTVVLVDGVHGMRPLLDERIAAAAEHWRLGRMPLIDRNVLRLGAYELLEQPEVPTAVVLNEAVELAKLLSTADSGRFVNGVLGRIARDIRGEG
ncbi:MAG TPA: transcription antitermination factor NusB [Actinomycetes bacterium]|nr:transcription antitermination factor NusB [Actinomycetes bacterium]